MADSVLEAATPGTVSKPRRGFYQRVLRALLRHNVPCLLGGTYALEAYTGVRRATKDLDLFIMRQDWDRAAEALAREDIRTELTFPHWLGKANEGRHYVDLLFCSGNGLCAVDVDWFAHAREMRIWRVPVRLCPPEELIWSKSFVQERERFDGADVLHIIHEQATTLDWDRLLDRYGANWEVLLGHLVLYGFVYPADRDRVPVHVRRTLLDRLFTPPPEEVQGVCRGTLLSREQYLVDIARGYVDARLQPRGPLTPDDLKAWTAEIPLARRAAVTRGRFVPDMPRRRPSGHS